MAVQPVSPSLCVAWPTSTPGTSQRLSSTPALRVRTSWRWFRHLPLFCVGELHGRVAERRALLELLVCVVLVAHAALHFTATAQYLFVRRNALLLGQPDVDRTHTPRSAPRRATQGQAARVASACVPRALYKAELPEGDLRVVGPFEAALDGPQIHFLVVGLVFDLDVRAVQGDVATDKLHAFDHVVPGELPGLFPDGTSQVPVAILRPGIL